MSDKKITLDLSEYEGLLKQIEYLNSNIHQLAVEGKIKVRTISVPVIQHTAHHRLFDAGYAIYDILDTHQYQELLHKKSRRAIKVMGQAYRVVVKANHKLRADNTALKRKFRELNNNNLDELKLDKPWWKVW